MDPAMYYEKNPVPWNLKKKKRGGIPINLYEGPIQCPDNVPYFNVYKVECDLRNNSVAQELQGGSPSAPAPLGTRKYVINRNYERFNKDSAPLDEVKQELNELPQYNDNDNDNDNDDEEEKRLRRDEEEKRLRRDEVKDTSFWWDNPCVLVDRDQISDFIPSPEMPLNRLLNSIVRFSVVLFVLVYLITKEISMLYLVVAAFLSTWYIYYYKKDSFEQLLKKPGKKKEKFIGLPSNVPGGVGTSNNPLDYAVYNTPAEFDDRLFKSNVENSGDYMQERNQVLSWDPFCPLSMTKGGFEHVLYGDNVKRHLFY